MTQLMEPPPALARQNGNGNSAVVTVFAPMADRYGMSVEKVKNLLMQTVMPSRDKAPTEAELAAFAVVANQYGLNPFTKEIHAFVDKGRVVPIVGIDGWSHIVNAHPMFNGCEFDETEDKDGKPLKTTCRMWVKGREHPVTVTERFSECKRNSVPWSTMPFRMLRHKAFMQAARLAFSISGIQDEDEARDATGQWEAAAASIATGSRSQRLINQVKGTSRPVPDGMTLVDDDTGEVIAAGEAIPAGEETAPDSPDSPAAQAEHEPRQQDEPPEAESPLDVIPWEAFIDRCNEAALDRQLTPADLNKRVTGWLVGLKLKGKHDQTTDAQRREFLAALRDGRVDENGRVTQAAK